MTTEIPSTDHGDEPLEVNANVDPVCEMTVEPAEAIATDLALEHEGRTSGSAAATAATASRTRRRVTPRRTIAVVRTEVARRA